MEESLQNGRDLSLWWQTGQAGTIGVDDALFFCHSNGFDHLDVNPFAPKHRQEIDFCEGFGYLLIEMRKYIGYC